MKAALHIPRLRPDHLAVALAAALAVLLSAWFLPLPRLLLSDEEQAATRMPQTVDAVESALRDFEQAQADYKGYVAENNVGAALDDLDRSIASLQADPANPALRSSVHAAAPPVLAYLAQLRKYLEAGNSYFNRLSSYDSDLMAWTRSLGAANEVLRPDTWPIVEYLKLYPPPVGLKGEYISFEVSEVADMAGTLENTAADVTPQTLQLTVNDIRAAGRSIEYSESLHLQYKTLLDSYLVRLQAVASNSGSPPLSGTRAIVAYGANILLALVLLAGLAALFLPRKAATAEANT